jgi:hypothetical protein
MSSKKAQQIKPFSALSTLSRHLPIELHMTSQILHQTFGRY